MSEKEIVREIQEALTLIENGSTHPVIHKKLADFGFASKNFKEGKNLTSMLNGRFSTC